MDITLKGLPDSLQEGQVKEWVAVLVERHENAKVNALPAVIQAANSAKTSIDGFRKANALTPKFEKVEAVEEAAIRG